MERESINRVKIEKWRVSQIPINPAETIHQGDMLTWDDQNRRATKLTTDASAINFIGLNETQNPVPTSAALLTDMTNSRTTVITEGLVELIMGEAVTVYPWDYLTVGADAQTVLKTGATADNHVGVVDPSVTAAGKALAAGAGVRLWLRTKSRYTGGAI